MKQTKEPLKVIDPVLLSKILGAVPSQDAKGQGVVIPQSSLSHDPLWRVPRELLAELAREERLASAPRD